MIQIAVSVAALLLVPFMAMALGLYRQHRLLRATSTELNRTRQISRIQQAILNDRGDTITQEQIDSILPGVRLNELPSKLELVKLLAKLTASYREAAPTKR